MNLEMLNEQQRKAAETLNGPVLILAGAGSGKTRALTYRVANLIDHGIEPWCILAITFTNKAAKEMKERISALVGERSDAVWVSTFHAMCAKILRRDIEKLGYTRSFTIYDDEDQSNVLKDLIKQFNIDDKLLSLRELRSKISDAKNRLLTPDEWFAESPKDFRSQQIHDVYTHYELRLKKSNALDFDDLLMRTLELLTDHPPVLESYRTRFSHVLVDEYQDTNFAQYSLVKLLTSKSRNLCVVGDDDQSIYGWRGADIRNILDFEKDFPDATVIKLEQNYRSTANILDAANQVIAHNEGRKEKSLWTDAPSGEAIKLFCAGDEREEAAWICDRMQQLKLTGDAYGTMSVLYRTNAQSRVLEEMLMRAGIPYRIYGGLRFYDRKEVKDIIAYLRCIVNPSDDVSLRRIINQPKRAIGESTIQELVRYAAEKEMPLYSALIDLPESLSARPRKCVREFGDLMNTLVLEREEMGLSAFVKHLIDKTGLRTQYEKDLSDEAKSRIENMDELLGAVTEYEKASDDPTLENYLENVALISDLDAAETSSQYVTLMTVHSAKGLEFPTVFVAGLEEGIFPSGRSIQDEAKLEEERRLCYVAITRAMQHLYLSYASQRMIYNQLTYNAPSRFISEIPKRLLDDEWISKREKSFPGAMDSYTHPTPRRSARMESKGPLSFGVPKIVTQGAGIGSKSNSLGIPGVQKGFTPSVAANMPQSAVAALFAIGDRVMHRKFGEGNITEIRGSGSDARVVISFAAYGEKEFVLSIAPIVKVNN
ncbi:MAG TPA: DNA helicase PcrA [Candidatus Limiplasma sp.]|nr:DNA helicase PcrA [Candidatus Limiplasma sp.]HPS81158.1 DNA helicase PcrA [Candidatus Limiplasma sp.]